MSRVSRREKSEPWKRVGDDLLQHEDNGYFLKVTEKLENITNCRGATIYRTAEGMYLADDGNFRMLKEAGVKAAKEPIHNLGRIII